MTQSSSLTSQEQIVGFSLQVKNTIVQERDEAGPLEKINHKTRWWWYAELLNPLKGNTLNLRRTSQCTNSKADKVAYCAAQAMFQKLVKDLQDHWHKFLENLTNKDLFTAAKYCERAPASRLLPPLQQTDGTLSDDPAVQAEPMSATVQTL